MNIKFLIALLFCNFSCMDASNHSHEIAHEKLSAYFTNEISREQRVKDVRITVLVVSAQNLKEGIDRKKFKEIRNQLAQGLLPSPANQPILARMQTITENHARKFPFCWKPWVFQSTIDREVTSLREMIDETLKSEHKEIYTAAEQKVTRSELPNLVQAYLVPAIPSAPELNAKLLDQYSSQNK
jgi:hypothetical protein